MGDQMTFPADPKEYLTQYSFWDKDEIYTNGSTLIPVFRVEQMLEHYATLKECAYIQDLQKKIPPALFGCVSERLVKNGCYNLWAELLECIDEMREAWEAEYGSNLEWTPGHYQKLQENKND